MDYQVNQDNLDHKALLDPKDLKELQVTQVRWDFLV